MSPISYAGQPANPITTSQTARHYKELIGKLPVSDILWIRGRVLRKDSIFPIQPFLVFYYFFLLFLGTSTDAYTLQYYMEPTL